jgi:DNA repair protein RecO (recombination protein O)
MGTYTTEGIVLRTRPVGEADNIITLFTVSEGKIGVSARGARRGRSRLLAATQPFTHTRSMLWRGRGLDSLSQAEIIQSFRSLREDLPRLAHASYAVELLEALVPERDPNPELFGLLLATLTYLSQADGDVKTLAKATNVFELRLLSILGYEPQLERCVVCGCEAGVSLRFSYALSGVVCPLCFERDLSAEPINRGTVAIMRQLLILPWERLSILQPGVHVDELQRVMRNLVDLRVESRLKSLEFLRLVQGGEAGSGGT